ncbi:MAG: hypothetical protein Q9160_001567 [Pyrenula sp. 1 TL-2023]
MPTESHRLPPSEFLTHLTRLFTTTHASTHGTVLLTQKPSPPTSTPQSPSILIRATNGLSKSRREEKQRPKSRVKISTVVTLEDSQVFFTQYAEVCKRGMEGLRRRDRKAKAKKKGKKKEKGKVAGEKGGA